MSLPRWLNVVQKCLSATCRIPISSEWNVSCLNCSSVYRMGKTRGLSKRREKATSSSIEDSRPSAVCSDFRAEGTAKIHKLATKNLTKFKGKCSKATKVAISDNSGKSKQEIKRNLILHAVRDKHQLQERTLHKKHVAVPLVLSGNNTACKSNISGKKKRKMQQDEKMHLKKKGDLGRGKKIPLAVVMPETVSNSDTNILPSGCNDQFLEIQTILEEDSTYQNQENKESESDSILPVLRSTPLPTNMSPSHDVPLVVSMTHQPAGLVDLEDSRRRNQCEDNQNTGRRDDLSTSSDLKYENLENSASSEDKDCESYNSNEMQRETEGCVLTKNASKMSSNITIHIMGNSVVLQLRYPHHLYLTGQVYVQVLRGRIEIFGYQMDSNSGSYIVSSLRGSSFLSIQPFPGLEDSMDVVIPSDLPEGPAIQSLISQSKTNETWVLLKKGDQAYLDFMQKYLEFPVYVKDFKPDDPVSLFVAQNKLKCLFHPENNLGKKMYVSKEWHELDIKLSEEKNGCTVICGGKGVGKSTLLRYLVNRALCRRERDVTGVVIMDFDPGQAELTPPGCVAISVVTQPLLGPNYTHLQRPERCIYIGQVDVCQCLGPYMEACSSLNTFLRESPHLANLPCFVNTMGFTKGIGVTIMGQLLKLVQPTHVVQIQSKRFSNNYPIHLTGSEVIQNSRSLDARSISNNLPVFSAPSEPDLNYELLLVQSSAEKRTSKNENQWGMRPKMCRDAVVLSYFYQTGRAPSYSFLDDVPFACPLSSLFLCVAHEQIPADFILAAMNGNMVGLCSINPLTENAMYSNVPGMPAVLLKVPIEPCLGFGIVRGVDMTSKMVYVTTPLSEDQLSSVNCLVFGAVNLPTTLYTKMTASGIVPYVSSGTHPDVSAPT